MFHSENPPTDSIAERRYATPLPHEKAALSRSLAGWMER